MEEEEEPLNGEQTAKWVAGGPGEVDKRKGRAGTCRQGQGEGGAAQDTSKGLGSI